MATKKYLSLERLGEYDGLIKAEIARGDSSTLTSAKSYTNTEIAKLTGGTTTVSKATTATNAEKLGGQSPSYYAKASDIPTGALASKSSVSESDLDSALAEKVNAASEGNHSHSNKIVLDDITSAKVTAWDAAEGNSKSYTDTKIANLSNGTTVVKEATHATSADSATSATTAGTLTTARTITLAGDTSGSVSFDGSKDVTLTITVKDDSHAHVIGNVDGLQAALDGKASSTHNHDDKYDAIGAASDALTSAQNYTNEKISELLDGADDTTLDSIKELADAIKNNDSAIDALNDIAAGKANATHGHAISDVSGLQSALDGKAASSHGTHVTFDSTNKPKMDGTAAFGTSSKVARADHVHPTDTSRAAQSSLDSHTGNSDIHVTSAQKTNWNAAKTHADSAHAPSNAQPNQNAFSNIAVSGQTTVAADTTTDTVTFAGSNVTITTDATNDKVTFSVADGTTSAKGVVKLTNSTSSTSTTTAATPSSVKSAYDLANTAKTNAATAQSKADSAYTLAEGKVSTNQGTANAGKILKINSSGNVVAEKEAENGTMTLRHDAANKTVVFENVSVENLATAGLNHLGITATADELNYMDGVTSNVQTQLNAKANSSDLSNYLPLSGGTLTGSLSISGGKGSVRLRSDNEGGNIEIHSPSSYNSYWEIDAHNGDLRLYRNNGGTLECFNTFPITNGTLLNTSSVGDAAYKGVTDSTSTGGNIGTGTALTTERDVYNGLPTINGSHTYSANTNIYAPTKVGTKGQLLVSNGSGAPSWTSIDTGSVSTGSISSSYTNTLTIYKRSGIVTISGSVTPGRSGRYTICTLASGYRPKNTVYAVSVTNPLDTEFWRFGGPVTIDTAGTVYVIIDSDFAEAFFTISYVAA